MSAKALAAFCAATVAFLVFRDLFIPHVRDTEVWFGFEVEGPLAWFTAPIHWLIFAVGAYGFWTQHPRIYAWAAGYAFYIAASHVMWNVTSPSGGGWVAALWQGVLFSIPGLALGIGSFVTRSDRHPQRSLESETDALRTPRHPPRPPLSRTRTPRSP